MKNITIQIIVCFLFQNAAFSQSEYSTYYQQTKDETTFIEIVGNGNDRFIKYRSDTTVFKTKETYWIKIEFNKQVEVNDVVLLLNTPISHIECFAFEENNSLKYSKAGISSGYNHQILRLGDKNKFFLNFKLKDNVVYLKIKNELFLNYNLDKIEVIPITDWVLRNEKQDLFQGIFVGIILILILIAGLYKISVNKYINYYFIGYMASILVLFIFLNEYTAEFIFFLQPKFDLTLMVFMHLASLLYIQFARNFFETKLKHHKIDTIVFNYIKFSIIAFFCLLIFSYFDFAIYSRIAIVIELLNQIFGLIILFFAFRKTDLFGRLIIFGQYVSTTVAMYMLYNYQIVEFSTIDLNTYQSGYIIELLFIIIAIKVKYNQFEKEKQDSLMKNIILEKEKKIGEHEILLLKKESEIEQLNNNLMQIEINKKNKEIAVNTMQLTQKEILLTSLYERIKKIQPETTGANKMELNKIIKNFNINQKDSFWNEFEIYFEQMHNSFFSKLTEKYPTLTNTEKRLCAFLKVGMTSKEIGNITQKNYKSIEVFRSRLRKKLELQLNENLADFLNSL